MLIHEIIRKDFYEEDLKNIIRKFDQMNYVGDDVDNYYNDDEDGYYPRFDSDNDKLTAKGLEVKDRIIKLLNSCLSSHAYFNEIFGNYKYSLKQFNDDFIIAISVKKYYEMH